MWVTKMKQNALPSRAGQSKCSAAHLSSFNQVRQKKGDVIGVARIAAIQAAKKTSDLIPLCHPLALTRVAIEFDLLEADNEVRCTATVENYGKTGVEMEALTAVSIGLLTIYDMCKAVDRGMSIQGITLKEKRGGKSGTWVSES